MSGHDLEYHNKFPICTFTDETITDVIINNQAENIDEYAEFQGCLRRGDSYNYFLYCHRQQELAVQQIIDYMSPDVIQGLYEKMSDQLDQQAAK